MRSKDISVYALVLWGLWGCQKQTAYQTAEDKLTDKVWYLEKKTIGQQTYNYTGTATFSFRLTKSSRRYTDSDGIEGTYTITEQPSSVLLKIVSGTRQIDAYQVTLIEKDYSILEYTKNNLLNTFYFSTRR